MEINLKYMEVTLMEILRIVADTGVKFVHGVVQTFGVLVEGVSKLSVKLGDELVTLDKKIITAEFKRKKKSEEEKPT